MELAELNRHYRKAFLEGDFQFPTLLLSAEGELKYAVRFPLYVNDVESYTLALNKAMMLTSYNNDINEAGVFAATEEGEFLFTARRNKIFLHEIVDNEFVEADNNAVDKFTPRVMREYLSTYSRKDYSEEVIDLLNEQGFEVHGY